MENKSKLCVMYILSFIASIAPMAIYVGVNHGKYIKTAADSVKLSLGFIICAVLVLLKVLGKLKIPSRLTGFGIVFALSYFLDSILNDLIVLSFLAFLGELIDLIIFQSRIKKLKERIQIGKTADATAEKIEEVMKQYFRGGSNEA